MAALPLLLLSIYLFLAFELAILALANFLFLRWFGISSLTATATLLAFDLLMASILAVITLAMTVPDTQVSDYLISAIGVLAVAYPILQAFFVRDQWSSESD
jgi:hypothetical protein